MRHLKFLYGIIFFIIFVKFRAIDNSYFLEIHSTSPYRIIYKRNRQNYVSPSLYRPPMNNGDDYNTSNNYKINSIPFHPASKSSYKNTNSTVDSQITDSSPTENSDTSGTSRVGTRENSFITLMDAENYKMNENYNIPDDLSSPNDTTEKNMKFLLDYMKTKVTKTKKYLYPSYPIKSLHYPPWYQYYAASFAVPMEKKIYKTSEFDGGPLYAGVYYNLAIPG